MKHINKIIMTVFIAGALLFGYFRIIDAKDQKLREIQAEVISVHKGYGYQIYSGDKLLVQQEFIPAATGNQPFQSPQDAQRVADLVMDKIKHGINPYISMAELQQLKVSMANQ